jgi:hypothetical protein
MCRRCRRWRPAATGSGSGSDWGRTRIGSGSDQDRIGIGSGSDQDRIGIGSGSDRVGTTRPEVAAVAQPLARALIVRTRSLYELPEFRRVIEPLQVHQLVDHHVVAHPRGHPHQTPVQADVTAPRARTPPPALIPDADPRHREAVRQSQVKQTFRKLARCARSLRPFDFGIRARRRDRTPGLNPQPLPLDPSPLILCELARLPLRSTARNRDADRTVVAHGDDVSPRARVPHELRLDGLEWQRELHDRVAGSGRTRPTTAGAQWPPKTA